MLGLGYRKRFRTKRASGKRKHEFKPKLAKDHSRGECLERRLAAGLLPLDKPKPPKPVAPPLSVLRLKHYLVRAAQDIEIPAETIEPINSPVFDGAVLADLLSGHRTDD